MMIIKDTVAKSFRSEMSIDQMLETLTMRAPDITWAIRDSEYDGRYVLGRHRTSTKFRIVNYGDHFSLEVYFWESSKPLCDEERREVMTDLDTRVLPIVKAADVHDED